MDFTYNIVNRIAVLREYESNGETWTKEVNYISWNGRAPKIDVREWDSEHDHCSKGVTLTEEEAEILADQLQEFLKERSDK